MKKEEKHSKKNRITIPLNHIIIIIVIAIFMSNGFLTFKLHQKMTGEVSAATVDDIIPSGIPFYGKELGVSYDDVIASLDILAELDNYPDGPDENVVWLDRYISIGMRTSCEYCCSAETLVFDDGKAACGCKHSWGMRGLLAWLLEHYPEKSDDEILTEVNKWKALFFPKQTLQKAAKAQEAGDVDYEKILNEMKDVPDMVGGC